MQRGNPTVVHAAGPPPPSTARTVRKAAWWLLLAAYVGVMCVWLGQWWFLGAAVGALVVGFPLQRRFQNRIRDFRGSRLEVTPERLTLLSRGGHATEITHEAGQTVKLTRAGSVGVRLEVLGPTGASGHLPLRDFDVDDVSAACLANGWTWMTPDGAVLTPSAGTATAAPGAASSSPGAPATNPAAAGPATPVPPYGAAAAAPSSPAPPVAPLSQTEYPTAPPLAPADDIAPAAPVGPAAAAADAAARSTEIVLRSGGRDPKRVNKNTVLLVTSLLMIVTCFVIVWGVVVFEQPLFALGVVVPAVVMVIYGFLAVRMASVAVRVSGERVSVQYGSLSAQVALRSAVATAVVGRRWVRLKDQSGRSLVWVPLRPKRTEVLATLASHGWPLPTP
jgi:hypothetical protein